MSESPKSPIVSEFSNPIDSQMEIEEFRIKIEKEIYNLSLEEAKTQERNDLYLFEEKAKDPKTEERNDLYEEIAKDPKTEEINDLYIYEEKAKDPKTEERNDLYKEKVVDGWGIDDNEEKVVDGWGIDDNEEKVVDDSNDGDGDQYELERLNNDERKINYPMRVGVEDCAYYMKFGTCKYGLNCKFNHPPRRKNQGMKERVKSREENSEKTGQIECKYHMTPGGCKFGNECKFNHGSDNSSISHTPELNFLGLPIRLGERECPYYMRTGSCKYGSSCRFHHPEPTTVGGSESGHGNGGSLPPPQIHPSSSWSSSPRAFSGTSLLPPVMFPPTQGVVPPNPEWNGYQAGTYQTSERGLPTPPALAMKNLQTQIELPLPHHLSMMVDEYPERPGEPECSFFLKTGDCKYKSSCKFHHPKNRKARSKSNSHSLSEKGLPLRPGQPICAHYHQYGICKYGPACKYDHPSNIGVLPTPFS